MNPPIPPLSAPHTPLSRGAVAALGLGAAVDGALTLALLSKGWTQGGAHIAGWLAGSLLWWLLAAWSGRGGPAAALPRASRAGWQLVAGVLAFPSTWVQKAWGFAMGFAAIQVANLLRIISLYYLARWNMQ